MKFVTEQLKKCFTQSLTYVDAAHVLFYFFWYYIEPLQNVTGCQ